MLTADHVGARRRGDSLTLKSPTPRELARAEVLASEALRETRLHIGQRREVLTRALQSLDHEESEARLMSALCKLLLDACSFQTSSPALCAEARSRVFSEAARARREGVFNRAQTLQVSADAAQLDVQTLEHRLQADTPRQDILLSAPNNDGASLVQAWQLARVQAIVLRAVELRCRIAKCTPAAFRALLRSLKFRQLLFSITPQNEGHLLIVTGPTRMFQAGTRYGMELALSLRALARLNATIDVDVLWGTERRVLQFETQLDERWLPKANDAEHDPRLEKLCADLSKEGLVATPNTRVLHIPGTGTIVPDLHIRVDGHEMFLELLGYWSRDAVFQRAEWSLKHGGLPVLFCVQERLRVSESIINPSAHGALYIYKESLRAKRVAEMLRGLAAKRPNDNRLKS